MVAFNAAASACDRAGQWFLAQQLLADMGYQLVEAMFISFSACAGRDEGLFTLIFWTLGPRDDITCS